MAVEQAEPMTQTETLVRPRDRFGHRFLDGVILVVFETLRDRLGVDSSGWRQSSFLEKREAVEYHIRLESEGKVTGISNPRLSSRRANCW